VADRRAALNFAGIKVDCMVGAFEGRALLTVRAGRRRSLLPLDVGRQTRSIPKKSLHVHSISTMIAPLQSGAFVAASFLPALRQGSPP